jgi:hypothetical protein
MSWLGKIMTFLVLIGVCVWAHFTVNAYVTRTNWKVRADAYEKALKDSETNRERERRDWESNRDALVRMYTAEKSRGDGLEKGYEDLKTAARNVDAQYKLIEQNLRETDVEVKRRDARIKTIQDELADTRSRNSGLEDEKLKLVLAKELADRAALQARLEAEKEQKLRLAEEVTVAALKLQVSELKATGGVVGGATVVARAIDKIPAPLPENIRGTVTHDMVGEFVQISIGIDAGLEVGSRLDIYRETGGGKYLGTLIVTRSLEPKKAVAEFRPARPVPVANLRPDELPKKGDTVGHISAGPGLR